VEEMLAVEDDNIRRLAAIFLLDEDVAVTKAARGLRAHEDRAFLLLHQLFVEVEVISFENLIAAVVY
jgi:hypothetical protein